MDIFVICSRALSAGAMLLVLSVAPMPEALSVAGSAQAAQTLSIKKSAKAPQGFASVCGRYGWACANRAGRVSEAEKLQLARRVNASVNRSVRPLSDKAIYGRQEVWALPTRGKGDCEDYALLKMKQLMDAGVASKDLLLATVLTRRGEHHVVLVVRTSRGDYFLDNLTGGMRPWRSSGYTVVKMQRPGSKSSWGLVLKGPMAAAP